jgi:diguanylate cyclase (GGDEF)-like protein/putative nucleotidyltransferase with HDIG domain
MPDWTRKRAAEVAEIVLVAHVLSLLTLLMIVAGFYNFPLGARLDSRVSTLSLLVLATGAVYLGRKLLLQLPFVSQPRLDEVLLLAVVFPATIALLWYSRGFFAAKVLIVIPATIAAVAFGSRAGTVMAALAGGLLFLLDYKIYARLPVEVFQTNVIVASATMVVAWLVGSLMAVERTTQTELARLADYDQLTGLINHRCFQEKLASCLEEAARKNSPLSLILLDIDQFRYYNTTYGYQKGDEILAAVGELLSQEVGEPFYAARYGSDEFVLVLPGKERNQVLEIAEETRQKIVSRVTACLREYQTAPSFRAPAVSSGLATYPADGEGVLPLSRAAEDDLFRAKYSKGKAYLYKSVLSHVNTLRVQDAFPSLQTFVALINARDRYTFGHSERVLAYALALADKLGLSEKEKITLRYGAYLHDIGKIEVGTDVLDKSGSLSESEWEIMKQHTVWGSEILEPLAAFRKVVAIVRSHHENYDGSGYPDGLKAGEIPLLARIVRIADSFDAMTTDRPYRKALLISDAFRELSKHAGTFYDPRLVDLFLAAVKERETHQLPLDALG